MAVPVKVDEDLPAEVSRLICAAGHASKTVLEQGHSGLPDNLLWPKIQQEQRLLVTADKGFANARLHPPGSHAGVVSFRLPRESRAGYIRLTEFLLSQVNLGTMVGAIAVVAPDAIRVLRA